MITNQVVAIFAKYCWKWGGYFEKDKLDYQHFQKEMDQHYYAPTLIIFRK